MKPDAHLQLNEQEETLQIPLFKHGFELHGLVTLQEEKKNDLET